MTKNKQIFVLGAIAFSSLLIPPNFGINFFGIGLEDIPLVGIFVFLFLNFLSNKTKNIISQKIKEKFFRVNEPNARIRFSQKSL